jgi:AcrR family transcriptional regulator
MEGVARAAGVTKPVVYELFPRRGALYEALLDREEQRALAQLGAIVPLTTDAPVGALVEQSIRALVAAVHERPDAWTVLLQAPESMPPGMRERYERRHAELVEAVRVLVRTGPARTSWAGNLDEELLGETLVALGEFAGRLALRHRDRYDADRLGSFVGALAATALRPEAAP